MAIDAKVSSPENYDKVQGNDQVAMINAKLGTKMNVGTDKYMFQDKGPKTVAGKPTTHNVQPGWVK